MAHVPPGTRQPRALLSGLAGGCLALTVAAGLIGPAGGVAVGAVSPAADGSALGRQQPNAAGGNGKFLVLLNRPPATSYRGGTADLARTAPRRGDGYDASSPAARAYTASLRRSQQAIALAVGAQPYYFYRVSLNGFAADLTVAQVRQLSRRDDVLAVVPDEVNHPAGMRRLPGQAAPALASAAIGRRLGPAADGGAGRGTVIGVVDTGVDSDSRSFAAAAAAAGAMVGPALASGFTGHCQPGRDRDAAALFSCNTKLVGGRYYLAGQGGTSAIWAGEHLSPEDYDGHGSHTASTAAGNVVRLPAGRRPGFGRLSGVAPRAAVAAYKACWTGADGRSSCTTSDTVAAIDQAVEDGVDVISYAVSGTSVDVLDPVQLAFMHATDAGIFVAAPAGQGVPRAGPVEHPSPWITTVAASTGRVVRATLVLGDGERHVGVSQATGSVPSAPLVLAADAAASGAPQAQSRLCVQGTLAPTEVANAIVVCERDEGVPLRQSAEVARAGGVGMVLISPSVGSVGTDRYHVPTIRLRDSSSAGLTAYAQRAARPTARLLARSPEALAPSSVAWSARGPAPAAGGDLLKPDIVAPGLDAPGAVTPETDARRYARVSGSSVSAAHVAGLGLLAASAEPQWSPMAVKSALMTTARDLSDTADPFVQGAGLVRPGRFLDPGLVLDSGLRDWAAYLAGRDQGGATQGAPIRASNVNLASIAVGDLAGRETVRRTLTNVDDTTATYVVRKGNLAGISVSAFPSVFSVAPGESQTVRMRFERDRARLASYETGFVRFIDGVAGRVVRLPVAVRPVGIRAPDRSTTTGASPTQLSTRSGTTGTLLAKVRGPVAGVNTRGSGADTAGVDFDPRLDGLWSQPLEVSGPAELVRVQTLPDDPADDLDIYLLDEDDTVVAASASGAAREEFTVRGLEPGTYTVHVQPWFVADSSGESTFTVRSFQVPRRPSGSLAVEPRRQSVSMAGDYSGRLEPTNDQAPRSSVGWVGWYVDRGTDDQLVGRTLVSVD